MAVTKEKKEEILKQLEDLFTNSKSIVFADYKGLSVKDMKDLRTKMRESEVTYKVAKKTLIKLAAEKAGFKDIPEEALKGQVGAAFGQSDEVAAAKTLYEFSKDNDNIKLLGALMEGRVLTKEETMELAKIPGKDELLAKLVGSMNSPISGFHGILSSLLRNFVGVVSAYKEKIEKDAPAEAKPEEAAAPEPAPAEPTKEDTTSQEAEAVEKSAEKAPEEPAKEEVKADEPKTEDDKPADESAPTPAEEAKPEADEPAPATDDAPADDAEEK